MLAEMDLMAQHDLKAGGREVISLLLWPRQLRFS